MQMRTSVLLACLALAVSPAGCSDSGTGLQDAAPPFAPPPPGTESDPPIQTLFAPGRALFDAARSRGMHAPVPVVRFDDPSQVVGSSSMKRQGAHVNVSLEAGDLPPGTATTLWAVIFNEPDACIGECDDPDLFENSATRADLLYVAGSIADGRGRVRYSGRIGVGRTNASIMPLFGLPAWGILDSGGAEVHLVVRTHGPTLPGMVDDQISTFNGGCTGFGSEFGAPGPNECIDAYFASHYAN